MFPFDPPENIRKPNISFPLIHTRKCMYQGGGGERNVRSSGESKREPWEEKS